MASILVATDKRVRDKTPFGLHWGTGVPDVGLGADKDLYIRFENTVETFYKKIDGAWVNLMSGGGFPGFDSSNSQLFELSSNTDSVVVTNFTIAAGSKLRIEKDGLSMYESYGVTRNTVTNAIDFDETVLADSTSKVLVFVGLYS